VHVTINGKSIWYGPPVAEQFDRLESLYDLPNLAGELASFVTATIKSSCSWTASMRKPDTATTKQYTERLGKESHYDDKVGPDMEQLAYGQQSIHLEKNG
jgi:hypothetical protein